jgi:hypothetical protein
MGMEARAGHNSLPRIQKVLIPYQAKVASREWKSKLMRGERTL